MNQVTFTQIPNDLMKMLQQEGNMPEIDESIPTGLVEERPSGVRLPVDEWVAKRRAEHKHERQNKKQGRAQRRRS